MMYFAWFAGYITSGAGWVLPVVMWAVNKDQDASGMINLHGRNIFNFMLSMLVYGVVAGILTLASFGILGFVLIPALVIYGIVVIIKGALAANEGQLWPIPLCIRFIK